MGEFLFRYIKLCLQTKKDEFIEYLHDCLTAFALEKGLNLYSNEPMYDGISLDYLERSYKAGYCAVINDGKFLGFVKEETP